MYNKSVFLFFLHKNYTYFISIRKPLSQRIPSKRIKNGKDCMKLTNIANCNTIDEYVHYKSQKLADGEQSFSALYQLMFSEKTNTFWETNDGYRIIKKTYGQAKQEIEQRAYTLQEQLIGVPQGAVVGLFMPNHLDWIELFWAILHCGYRPLLLNTRMDKAMLNDVIARADAKAVVSDGEQFSVPTVLAEQIICADTAIQNAVFGDEILLTTSGTSNSVKICVYDAAAMIHQILNAEQIVKTSRLIKQHYEGELKLLTFLPFYHIFGLTAMYMWFAFYSRTFVYLKDMSSQCILNTIRRHKVTHIFAVPLFWNTVYEQAMKQVRERGEKTMQKLKKGLKISHALSGCPALASAFRKKAFAEIRTKLFGESICFMITGGGCISETVLAFFNGIGYHLSNGYGMSEIGITSVELSEDNRILNSGTIGKPMQSVAYTVNPDGELLVKGNSLCKYYIENGQNVYIDGWFNTKDLAREEKGRYYLTGRKDDLIVSSSGENLNPNLYEYEFTIEHVKKVCMIDGRKNGLPYPVLLVSVVKYISHDTRAKVLQAVKEQLKSLNILHEIKEIVLVGEDLIKGNEFKLNRKRLAEEYIHGRLATLSLQQAEGEPDCLDEIEKQVAVCFERVLGKAVDKHADFFTDAGGTSLEYFTLVTYIQEEFDVVIRLSNEQRLTTVYDFSAYIKGNL